MPSFRNAKKQAAHAVKTQLKIGTSRHTQKKDLKIHSLGTARNYEQALTRLTRWLQTHKLGSLKELTLKTAQAYLEICAQVVHQKTVDQERQAVQMHLGIQLPVIQSELVEALQSRAYSLEQIACIANAQAPHHRLATEIAEAAGLRAHELFTLRLQSERAADTHRTWSTQRFLGRQGELYTVRGKGGLTREVLLPAPLAHQLEKCRLRVPLTLKDRDIFYETQYGIGGGKAWSNSFSSASQRVLGWSHGAHGLRHTFAQARMEELQQRGLYYSAALEIVSQELGHFRPEITEVYLR